MIVNTGIFIRAEIDGKWMSIDIGDPRLNAMQLLKWLTELSDEQVLKVMTIARVNQQIG